MRVLGVGGEAVRFKLRAECMSDVGRLLQRICAHHVEIMFTTTYPDVVVTLDRPFVGGDMLDLTAVRAVLAEIVDGHVMVETVALADDYTGERVS